MSGKREKSRQIVQKANSNSKKLQTKPLALATLFFLNSSCKCYYNAELVPFCAYHGKLRNFFGQFEIVTNCFETCQVSGKSSDLK